MKLKRNRPHKLTALKWYAIDFDKTICLSKPDKSGHIWDMGEPTEGVRDFLFWVKSLGKKIIIHTARSSEDYIEIEEWMKKHDLPFDMIWPGKVLADVYIDDKAVHYGGNWNQVKKDLRRMGKA